MSLFIHLPSNPSARVGSDTKSVFKLILLGFNSNISFSKTGCHTKFKGLTLTNYSWKANRWIHNFLKGTRAMGNANNFVQDLNSCPYPTTETVAPRTPSNIIILCKVEVPVVWWLSSQEMDTVTRVQILVETDCISHSTNTLGKGMNPITLPRAMGK